MLDGRKASIAVIVSRLYVSGGKEREMGRERKRAREKERRKGEGEGEEEKDLKFPSHHI